MASRRRRILHVIPTLWSGAGDALTHLCERQSERDEVTVVDDQVGCPTYTGHLATALLEIAERGLTGTFHVAGGGQCSWYDLAAATFGATGAAVTLKRGSSADLDRPAPRPAYSVLGTEREDTPRLPDWREGLAAHLQASTREAAVS